VRRRGHRPRTVCLSFLPTKPLREEGRALARVVVQQQDSHPVSVFAVAKALRSRNALALGRGILAGRLASSSNGLAHALVREPTPGVMWTLNYSRSRKTLLASESMSGRAVHLSTRQREVLVLRASGVPDKDIAHRLQISERMVRYHLQASRLRLSACSRSHLVALAILAHEIAPVPDIPSSERHSSFATRARYRQRDPDE